MRRYGLPIVGVEIAVIGIALWSGLRPISSLHQVPRWSWFTLAILLGLAMGAAIAAVNPGLALVHFQFWLVHLLFGLSVACLAEAAPENVRANFWPTVVAGLIAYALLLTLYVALIPDPADFNWLRFGFAVTNIRHVGYFAVVGIAASVGIALTQTRIVPTLAACGAACIFFALVYWSGSRGALIASWAALLFSMIWFKRLRTIRTVAIIIACSGAGLLLSRLHRVPDKHFGLERIKQVSDSVTLDDLTSGRMTVWRAAWDAILDRPLFGHGQGQFGLVVTEVRHLEINHPHNSVLQVVFDWGLLGAACFAAMLLFLCWHCLKLIGENPKGQLPAFLVCAALIAMSLHDGAFFFTYPISMLVVALAWIAGTERTRRSPPLEGTSPRGPSFT